MKKEAYVYHVVPLEQVHRGRMVADPQFSDVDFQPAYRWLEKEVGYYPLFLAVGDSEAMYVTGYQNQWRVFIGGDFDEEKKYTKIYRKAGEFPNFVLFAFPLSKIPTRHFTDYQWWHIVLNDVFAGTEVSKGVRRTLFKKSWPESKWLRHAAKDSHFVQMVAPQLDLDAAEYILVRNKRTQKLLLQQGFKNVKVKRLKVES